MSSATALRAEVRSRVRTALRSASRPVWREALSRQASFDLLRPYVAAQDRTAPVSLPELRDASGRLAPYFSERTVPLDPDCVWRITRDESVADLRICRAGTVLVNRRFLLNLDFGSVAGLLDTPVKTRKIDLPLVVAPWSHFYRYYYDFIVFVLAKLCRIEETFGPEIWRRASICYPLFHTPYERECLHLLGIDPDRLVDTRPWGVAVTAREVIAANNQPMFTPSPENLMLLRRRFCPDGWRGGRKRLFVSRRGRRRVRNEADVRAVLRRFGFEVVEDVPRPVSEQIRLFGEASVVVGPHGSGLTNLLWCTPGTRVLELFHSRFTPPYFQYFCAVLGLPYAYLMDEHAAQPDVASRQRDGDDCPLPPSLLAHTADDMEMDPAKLTLALERLVA